MTPDRGEATVISIFMASRTMSLSPSATCWPAVTLTSTTMPGMVVEVKIAPGQQVAEGDKLMVLEAMKMEMTVASPISGVIKEVLARPKDRVDAGDLLVVFK